MCSDSPMNGTGCTTTLSNSVYLQGKYFSKTTITSSNQVASEKSATLIAGESICLEAGFHTEAGGDFLAKIEPCTTPSFKQIETIPTIPTILAKPPANIFNIAPNPFSISTKITINIPSAKNINLFLRNMTMNSKPIMTMVKLSLSGKA